MQKYYIWLKIIALDKKIFLSCFKISIFKSSTIILKRINNFILQLISCYLKKWICPASVLIDAYIYILYVIITRLRCDISRRQSKMVKFYSRFLRIVIIALGFSSLKWANFIKYTRIDRSMFLISETVWLLKGYQL